MRKYLLQINLGVFILAGVLILSVAGRPAIAASTNSKDKDCPLAPNTSSPAIAAGNGSTFIPVKDAVSPKLLTSTPLTESASYAGTKPSSAANIAQEVFLPKTIYIESGVSEITACDMAISPANLKNKAVGQYLFDMNSFEDNMSTTKLPTAYIESASTINTFTTININQNLYLQQRNSAFKGNSAVLSWAVTTRKPAINFQQKPDSIQNVAAEGLTNSASIRSSIVQPQALKDVTIASPKESASVQKKEATDFSGQKATLKPANQPLMVTAIKTGKVLVGTVSKISGAAEITLKDLKKKNKDIVKSVQSRTSQTIKRFIQQKIIDAFVAFSRSALFQNSLLKAQLTIEPSDMFIFLSWDNQPSPNQESSSSLPIPKPAYSNQHFDPELQGIIDSIANFDQSPVGLIKQSHQVILPVQDHFINNGLSPPSSQAISHDTVIRDTVISASKNEIHASFASSHSLSGLDLARLNYIKINPLFAPAYYLASKKDFSLLSNLNRLCGRVSAKAVYLFLQERR